MSMSWLKRRTFRKIGAARRPVRGRVERGSFRPLLETLEERVLPAISAIFSAAAGQLRITGDDQANTIIISRDAAGTLLVNGGAVAIQGDPGANIDSTHSIMITGAGGDDVLLLSEQNGSLPAASVFGGAGNDVLIGGSGNDFVDGGPGNDLVFLGDGDDTFQWNSGDGSDTVEGQGGRDSLTFNGSDAPEKFDVSASNTRVRLTRDIGGVTMDLSGIEGIDLNAQGGADTITINDQSTTDLSTLNLDLGGLGGLGDNQADTVIANGSDRNDFDQIRSTGSQIDATLSQIPFVHITDSEGGLDTLAVNTLGGNDVVDAADLAATNASQLIKLTVSGGPGNDTLIGSQGFDTFVWNPGDGSDLIDGGDGEDTMVVNGSNLAEKFDLSARDGRVRITRNVDGGSVSLDRVENITVNPLGGADTVTVNDLTGTSVAEIRVNLAAAAGGLSGDGQADTVVVNGTNGPDMIPVLGRFVGPSGEGVVAVDGGADVVGGLPYFLVINQTEGAFDTLTVNALGGNDTVDLSDISTTDASLPIKLIANGGAGNDTIVGSPGDDTFVWNSGDGSDTIDGRAGSDKLTVSDSDAAERIAIARSGSGVRLSDVVGSVSLDLQAIEGIDLSAQGGADVVTVNDLSGTGLSLIRIHLEGLAGGGDGQPDNIVVNGTADDDVVRVAAAGNIILVDGLFPAVRITGAEPIDRLTVNGLGGNNQIDSSNLPPGLIGLTVTTGDEPSAMPNVAPSFAAGPDQVVTDESGQQDIPGWATAISPGPLSEVGQHLHFIVLNNTHPELFAVAPAVDAAGTLTFVPAPNAHGTSQITIQLQDDGGTASGGSDTSSSQTLNITVDKPHPLSNTANPLDVTGDGQIAPLDALTIINFINASGPGAPATMAAGPPFYDVNRDGIVAPSDALSVINALNALNAAEADRTLRDHLINSEIAAQALQPPAEMAIGDTQNLEDLLALLAADTAVLGQRPR